MDEENMRGIHENARLSIRRSLSLLWKYPVILVLSLFLYIYVIANIFAYCMLMFFTARTGTAFNFRTFIERDMDDIGAMQIFFELSFLAVVFVFARYIDKFSYKDIGISIKTKALYNFSAGVTIAGVFIALVFAAFIALGLVDIKGFYWNTNASADSIVYILIYQIILLMLVASQEEMLHRAYLIKNMSGLKPFLAILLSSIVFAVLHLMNMDFGSIMSEMQVSVIGIINIFIIGMIYGYYFYFTNDLWFVIGTHFSWNFLMGPIFGLPISGDSGEGVLTTTVKNGNKLFTGGQFGPEGGILVTVSLAMMFIIIRFYIHKKTKYYKRECKIYKNTKKMPN